jgi:hypothetical protein
MSSLKFNMKLVGNNTTIAKAMLSALVPELSKYLDKVYNQMAIQIPDILIQQIQNQPEYASLLGGKLQGEFGIPDPQNRLGEILDTIRNGKVVVKNPVVVTGQKIKGGIKLQMVKKDFQDLLSLGSASFTTEKGSNLEWLKWLLIEGDSIIISNYEFVLGPSPYSRTGMGIMREIGSSGWRVPPEFAGSINNNWITRAIDASSTEINNIMEKLAQV